MFVQIQRVYLINTTIDFITVLNYCYYYYLCYWSFRDRYNILHYHNNNIHVYKYPLDPPL